MSRSKKLLIWDLDNTLWHGILLEGNVVLNKEIVNNLRILDSRGILFSIASKGNEESALKCLKENNILDYFLVPKINWNPKYQNITAICNELNLNTDSAAFIDDDEFEREQVSFMLPDIFVIDAQKGSELINFPEFNPADQTSDSAFRRKLYQTELIRKQEEQKFISREDFLISCKMQLHIRNACSNDAPRVQELMTRTHQLNTTGIIFSDTEIKDLISNKSDTRIFTAELKDRFGNYGIIGIVIIEMQLNEFIIKYLALSCRVMGRGIEKALIYYFAKLSASSGLHKITAEFLDTGKNKLMRTLYQMTGFLPENKTGIIKYSRPLNCLPDLPKWVELV